MHVFHSSRRFCFPFRTKCTVFSPERFMWMNLTSECESLKSTDSLSSKISVDSLTFILKVVFSILVLVSLEASGDCESNKPDEMKWWQEWLTFSGSTFPVYFAKYSLSRESDTKVLKSNFLTSFLPLTCRHSFKETQESSKNVQEIHSRYIDVPFNSWLSSIETQWEYYLALVSCIFGQTYFFLSCQLACHQRLIDWLNCMCIPCCFVFFGMSRFWLTSRWCCGRPSFSLWPSSHISS
jgi:hypothetical protein